MMIAKIGGDWIDLRDISVVGDLNGDYDYYKILLKNGITLEVRQSGFDHDRLIALWRQAADPYYEK